MLYSVLPGLVLGFHGCDREVGADGACDTWQCRYAIHERGASAVIPPREDAVISQRSHPAASERNEAIKHRDGWDDKHWKKESGYHARSLVETAMFQVIKITD